MFNVFFEKKIDDDPEGEWEPCLKPSFGKNSDVGMAGVTNVKFKRNDIRAVHMKHGPGIMRFRNGDVYEGQWDKNLMHGRGKMVFADGQVYIGCFANNFMHGAGELTDAAGNIFEGHWIEDKKNGLGVEKRADGSVYTGEWKDDVKLDGAGVHSAGTNRFTN